MPMEQLEDVTNVRNLVTRQAVRVVASLGIPDLIAAGITDVDALAVARRSGQRCLPSVVAASRESWRIHSPDVVHPGIDGGR